MRIFSALGLWRFVLFGVDIADDDDPDEAEEDEIEEDEGERKAEGAFLLSCTLAADFVRLIVFFVTRFVFFFSGGALAAPGTTMAD